MLTTRRARIGATPPNNLTSNMIVLIERCRSEPLTNTHLPRVKFMDDALKTDHSEQSGTEACKPSQSKHKEHQQALPSAWICKSGPNIAFTPGVRHVGFPAFSHVLTADQSRCRKLGHPGNQL